jgi:transposase InsO family protein
MVESKLHLGPYRLAWDLQNQHRMRISPATIRRVKRAILDERDPRSAPVVRRFYERKHPHSLWHGDFFEKVTLTDEDRTAYQLTLLDDYSRAYVYCDLLRDPTLNDTIRALIAAMRQYQTIPKGVVFDNGTPFKGNLLSAFCTNLGIRLIHSAVRHPQTNGKLERAFRDDRKLILPEEMLARYDTWPDH